MISRFIGIRPQILRLYAARACAIRPISTTRVLRSTFKEQPILVNPKPTNQVPKKPDTEEPKPRKLVFSAEELEAARLARLAGLGWLKNLPEKWIPYAELMRLEKPVGTLLLLIPSFWGITMAAYSVAAPLATTLTALTLFSIGSLIMRGAGCTVNDLLDRKLDAKVARTTERPIASGRVPITNAVLFTGAQGLAGLVVLLCLPWECFYVAAMSLPIITVYPLFKRFTYYPQTWFSLCFSWAILVGYPAVGAPMTAAVIPLFLANWIWGIVYDTVYAHQDKKFDVKAGIKSTALAWGDKSLPILNKLVVAQGVCYTAAGVLNSMGPGFLVTGVWGFSRLYKRLNKVDFDDPKSCWSFFIDNTKTGFIFWLGMFADYLLKLLGYLPF